VDRRQDGASASEDATGRREAGVEGGGVRETWGADVMEAVLAKVRSSSSIDILARTRRSQRAAL